MRSLNKPNKNHPEKKKTGPAVKKESHKNDASLSDKKKTKNKKVVGKVEPQHMKNSAPIIKGKSSKNPALPAAAKKQSANPAGKAEKQNKKKEAPIVKTKPKIPALPAAAKKQSANPAGKAEKQNKKKEAPIVKTKPKIPALPAAAKKQSAKPAGKAEKHGGKKVAPVDIEKTSEPKVISFEMDQLSEKKEIVVSSVVLGKRYKCYKCGIKFYDLGKPQPLCPSCGANPLDGVIKAARKRRGKQRSAFMAKTEPHNIVPDETEDLHEVVDELDAEFVLDMDDIVLEEHEDTEDKE